MTVITDAEGWVIDIIWNKKINSKHTSIKPKRN